MTRRFGRVRSTHELGAAPFRIPQAELDAAPPGRDWIGEDNDTFPLFGNDQTSDCTCATLFDRLVLLGRLDSAALYPVKFPIDAATCEQTYAAVSGYDGTPGDASDRGAQPINVLTWWNANRLPIKFARVSPQNGDELRAAINLYGPVYVGADLPRALDDQGFHWDMPPIAERDDSHAPDPDRGHAFLLAGYDRLGFSVVTWGSGRYRASNAWVEACVDEAWILFDRAWADETRPAPNGFDFTRLRGEPVML